MKTDDFRRSDNIEDRRDMSPEASTSVAMPPLQPMPPLVRRPGDLPSQLGIDDIGKKR
jgi:hypothetical protein